MIARFLGHEQIETTREYINPSMEQLRAALENTITVNGERSAVFLEDYEKRRARLYGIG